MSKSRFAGVQLERKKDASLLNWNLKRPYPPEKIRVRIPPCAVSCVCPGDKIEVGQKIADPVGAEGASVHAGLAGTVEKIEDSGSGPVTVEIRRHGEPKALPAFEPRKGWEELPSKDLPAIFRNAGLVLTDPSEEPVTARLARCAGARTVLVNACEPEPYITCEQVLTMSHAVEILRGAELLRKACGAEKILFAAESSNLEMIELIKSKIYFLKWDHVEVRTVPPVYPQGLEATLLRAWFPGGSREAVVFPASTAFAAYEAVALQKPFYERVVTVGGECTVEPRSLWLLQGLSLQDAIRTCKGTMREPKAVLLGGPMKGRAQEALDGSLTPGSSAVLALPPEVVWAGVSEPCIRCNRCVDHCPVALSPVTITLAAERKEFAIAREWHALDCIECGNCSYVCPSKRPMAELLCLARKGVACD